MTAKKNVFKNKLAVSASYIISHRTAKNIIVPIKCKETGIRKKKKKKKKPFVILFIAY